MDMTCAWGSKVMSYAINQEQSSLVELARSGNFRAIAYWLNVFLLPHQIRAQVGAARQPGHLQIVVEFHPRPQLDPKSPEFRKNLVRFVCHHLWKLDSEVIEGIQITAKYMDKPRVLWRQSARVVSPARRAKLSAQQELEESPDVQRSTDFAALRSRIQKVTLQKVQFRALRSLLLTGTTAAAFIIGCWLGYADSPAEQTTATASSVTLSRPETVTINATPGGTESVPVTKLEGNPTAQDDRVNLLFSGDVALTEGYSDLVKADHNWAFASMDEYRQADVAMVNLDAPFTTQAKDAADKADPATVEVLKSGGVDIVNLADSRTMDYQAAGLEETLKTLDNAGIQYVGAGENAKAAQRPKIVDVKGQRIAYLGYSEAELQAAGAAKAGVNPRQNERVAADIQAIRPQVDWVIVNYHWGEELAKYPADWQIDLAHTTIDHGADVVVGHHSHSLQGAEIYKGRPIVYSLGNFIFGEKASTDYDTAVLKVGVKDRQMKVELLPVEVKGLQPSVVSGDRAQEILHQIENVSDTFAQPLRSPMILDAQSNTILSQPAASPKNLVSPTATPSEPAPAPVEATPSESPPSSLEPQAPFTDGTSETPIPSETPTSSESPPSSPEPQAPFTDGASEMPIPSETPTPSELPLSTPAAPDPEPSTDHIPSSSPQSPSDSSETQPSPTLDLNPIPTDAPSESTPDQDSSAPSPEATPDSSPDSFISDPNSQAAPDSPGPMVPQQPTPTNAEPSSELRGDATSAPAVTSSRSSLEPRKRRYAATSSATEVAHHP